ncbi:hypothetical protein RU820_05955 [Acidithiobacillus ferrooxidans]|uniref:hypothetical protein n=1 Tax=Acidithiobacillus TaxID=119977 RepID=UPI0005A14C69|nr:MULTISPECIES: hypothetical protein [Acidithiobacillus]MBN6745546.1 hypothetical protein [Acidithiobacillus sp. MC2.2]MBN6748427.1 hypothetical protein [Acidithiobacillus sp. PG05]
MEGSQIVGLTQATGPDWGCYFYSAHRGAAGCRSLHAAKNDGLQSSDAHYRQGEALTTPLAQRIVGSVTTATMLCGMMLAFDAGCWPLLAFLAPVSLVTAGIGFFAVDR